MKCYWLLRLKKLKRTARKLVFKVKTGELALVKENEIDRDDINIDQIFYADGVF